MRRVSFYLFMLILCTVSVQAQRYVDDIYLPLEKANKQVVDSPCYNRRGMIVTSRAFNYLMSNTLANYLTEGGDISLFGAYATLNSKGGLSLNENFISQKKLEKYGDVKHFFTIGINGNIREGFSNIFTAGKFSKGFSINARYTFRLFSSISFDSCRQQHQTEFAKTRYQLFKLSQKERMNVARATILSKLKSEISEDVLKYENGISSIDPKNAGMDSAQFNNTIKDIVLSKLRNSRYGKLKRAYEKKFAELQIDQLEDDDLAAYNKMSVHWLSLGANVPLSATTYYVAPSLTGMFQSQDILPYELNVRYNYLRKNKLKYTGINPLKIKGVWLFNLGISLARNNNILTSQLSEFDKPGYFSSGGKDTVGFNKIGSNDKVYIGNNSNFLSTILKGQVVFFPDKFILGGNNFGFSLSAEQFLGNFKSTNGKFGIPVRLNDSKGNPTINFELQLRSQDLFNTGLPNESFWMKSSFGISVGLPFNSFIY